MARRYEIEELLWLRNSPLVTKPDKLPPIEEWMGPIPDPAARKPTNPRDQPQNDNQNRRPNLFEPRHISRNSNSEDIVLGPPKTAFSSATRLFGRGSIDATDRATRFNDPDEAKTDRFNFKDKIAKDRDDLERRDNKFGSLQGRRNEREDWNAGRSRRTFNQDEQDPKFRRNGDATRWDGKDRPDESRFNQKDKDGRFVKRETQPRGRNEQTWFRDEIAPDAGELEEEKPYMRNREWRRGDRQVPDRDWNNRNPRFEQDPEWMDSTDRDEPRQAHTQEDFQRWKEKMKAGSAAPQSQFEEKAEIAPEQQIQHHKAEPSHLDGELFASNQAPIGGLDNFFKLLRDSKQMPQEVSPTSPADTFKKDSVPAKASSKSSRFAGLFSPPPDSPSKQQQPEPVLEKSRPDRPVSTDADQEGFQRILQMLGGSKSRNATPQLDSTQSSRPPSYSHPDQNRPTPPPPPGLSSPSRDALNRQHEFMTPQDGVAPRAVMPPPGMESMIPRDPQAQFRDRDTLLRLMQQAKISPTSPGQHGNASMPSQGGHTPGILSVPDLLSRPQGMQKAPRNQVFLDDPAIANMQRPDVDLHEQPRRPVNGPPMGYFDEMPFPGAPQGGRGSAGPAAGGRAQGHPPPMGIPRPPGFEQMPPPPPGWTGQMPPQQATPNRGMNPNFLNGPVPMHGGNMPPGPPPPPPNERPPFMRGISGGPPPGMMPPPGYMNGPPPPPGYPPMHHNPEAAMGAGSSVPPPSSRNPIFDMMFQANGGGDGRGAMLGGPPFR